ncbi:hypothetical protein EYB26_003635 [Talaromyces marneffei]|uniref:uncharacterized protein n=1 Tax=Talaromyces marneffei TaxID=37727 RepID=UPI0012A93558|nr:uncharacterized protein EYB26_003635 [Talaromyces marneffei]QGA15968.1 hypothetical protein EYB26_003635 [Talaromyces marneffei]
MDRSMFSSTELRLARERRLKFQGTAKINISQISLPSEYKPDNVERLRRIFDSEDCDRLSLPNHVVATISREHLMSALSGNEVNANALMSQPPDSYVALEFPIGQVTCLHGQHRLRAGREFLAPYDRWWTVDLYLDDISRELETELTDEYANEATPTDGEVYRKVRQYQYEASARFEERWLSRLTENKQKRMRQLSQRENSLTRSAFDSLLPIPGLWNGMSIGNLPRVIAVKCDEEIIHYLCFIKDFWSSLVEHDRSRMEKIDCMTVEKLQLLVPGGLDRTKVKGLMLSGEAFPKFSQAERKSIWRVLRRRGEIVPSLHTFFKDLSYLEVTSSCLGRLVDLAAMCKRTMRSAMKQIYNPARHGRGRYQMQVSETEFRSCFGTVEEGRESGYRQLWLFAFRHYLQMPKARQKEKRHAKTKFREANDGVVHRMASLALQLGFDSPQIRRLIDDSPDRRLALEALLKARDRDQYRYDSIDMLVNQIVACFNEAVPVEIRDRRASAPFSTIPRQSRCGKPSLETHEQEQNFLFLDQIESQPSDESVSALYVRRCVYFAFFGRPSETPPTPVDEDHSTRHSSPHPPPSPLFVPEEHNPSNDHQMTGFSDHVIDRPDTQHRNSRREERRERRQRRRQERQTRRRQRESRRQRMSNGGHEGGPAARPHSVDQIHGESSRVSSGNITEVEIDAGNEHESTQPDDAIIEELRGNALPANQTLVDPSVAEPIEIEAALEEDSHGADTLDDRMVPELVINDTDDNPRPHGFTEANTPGELDENVSPTRQEPDHLGELPSGHLTEDRQAVISAFKKDTAGRRRARPSVLKRTVKSRRQAAAQTRLRGKKYRLTQVDIKQGHKFTSDTNLPIRSPLDDVVAEERAQTLAQLEERPVISESAVADHADLPQTSPPPSVPEFLDRVREPESPVEESHEPTNIGEDPYETAIEDRIMTPEIIIHEPSPELNTPTEANTPPREVANGEALIRQEEDDRLTELPSTLRLSIQDRAARLRLAKARRQAARRSRHLGLKRSAKARRQAAAQTRLGGKNHRLTQVDVTQGHQFTPGADLGAENLPSIEDLTGQSPLEAVVADERAQTLAQLEQPPTVSEPAVADPANPPLPSMPELIARLRESESPVEGNHGDDIGNSPQEHPQEDLRQERSERPSREAARPEVLTDDRESRRKVPRDKRIAEEARRRQDAKQRAENTPRAAQEFENDFTQTQSEDDLFNDNDNGELAPLEGNHTPPPAAAAAREANQGLPSTSSPSQPQKAGRKQFARPARQGPYRRPIEKSPRDRDRPLTQINMQLTASDQPPIAPGDPPLPAVPPSEPPTESPSNTLPVPQPPDRSVERKRKAANMIRERRPPVVASPSNDLVIFRVWTGTRWTERTKVVVEPSDPLRCEREAKRFVEAYHAQLRDARLRILMPSQCLQSARQDGSQSVFLIFPEDRTINKDMEQAAAAFIGFTRHRISAAHSTPWPLGRHGGRQWAGWALWPGPYGPGGDQDGSMRPCPDVLGFKDPAYRPLLYVYIYMALTDTETSLYGGSGHEALDQCPTTTYGQPSHMVTAS